MDFAKAFDEILHNTALHKLESHGTYGHCLALPSSFLMGLTFTVKAGSCLSEQSLILAGVPQVPTLGTLIPNLH